MNTLGNRTWWKISAAVSILLLGYLVNLWFQMNRYDVEPSQLTSEETTGEFLKAYWAMHEAPPGVEFSDLVQIKTGVFLQSLKFFNSSEVHVSGYIWQRYEDGVNDRYIPEPGEVGFILPEQVDSLALNQPTEQYRYRDGSELVIGWYFEATLRQPFNYNHYPFDHTTVWLRLWPKEFIDIVILVPDFKSYGATGPDDIFGIEQDIVLGAWTRANTFFDYKPSTYDTNFGIQDYVDQRDFPELHYNFVIKRKFENAFIVYLLPLFLVASLLFAALLTVSNKEKVANKMGFNVSGFIGACSALFFVVMLAHIQLREQFAGTSIVYIEYFYILMYAFLVISTANTYLFSVGNIDSRSIVMHQDNILPKVAYWPVLLLSLVIITLMV